MQLFSLQTLRAQSSSPGLQTSESSTHLFLYPFMSSPSTASENWSRFPYLDAKHSNLHFPRPTVFKQFLTIKDIFPYSAHDRRPGAREKIVHPWKGHSLRQSSSLPAPKPSFTTTANISSKPYHPTQAQSSEARWYHVFGKTTPTSHYPMPVCEKLQNQISTLFLLRPPQRFLW